MASLLATGISDNKIEFKVSSTSYMPTGVATKTLNGSAIYNFVGYNLVFIRNGIPQNSTITTGTYFTWDKVSGLFRVYGVPEEDELFQIFAI